MDPEQWVLSTLHLFLCAALIRLAFRRYGGLKCDSSFEAAQNPNQTQTTFDAQCVERPDWFGFVHRDWAALLLFGRGFGGWFAPMGPRQF